MQSPGSEPFTMSRVNDGTIDEMLETGQFRPGVGVVTDSDPSPLLILSVSGLEGASGTVHATTSGTVVKFAHRTYEAWRSLVREADMYRTLMERHVSSVPVFYGLFASGADLALVLSDEGSTLDTFSGLSLLQR